MSVQIGGADEIGRHTYRVQVQANGALPTAQGVYPVAIGNTAEQRNAMHAGASCR
jgi:hypothetical protein